MTGRIADRVALVAGAGIGISRAIALRLADEEARLALIDIDAAVLDEVVATVTKAAAERSA